MTIYVFSFLGFMLPSLVEIFPPARISIISDLPSPDRPVVLLMMRPPAELIVEEHRDDATASVLHEVGESWLEVISIGELECVSSLHSSIKDEATLGRVCLWVVLLPDVLPLEGSPQDSTPLLKQGLSPRGSTTNRHLF